MGSLWDGGGSLTQPVGWNVREIERVSVCGVRGGGGGSLSMEWRVSVEWRGVSVCGIERVSVEWKGSLSLSVGLRGSLWSGGGLCLCLWD